MASLFLTLFSVTFFNPKYWLPVMFFAFILYYLLCSNSRTIKLIFMIEFFLIWYFLNAFFTLPLIFSFKYFYGLAQEVAGIQELFEASTSQSDLLSILRLILSLKNLTWALKKPLWKNLYFYDLRFVLLNTFIVVVIYFPLLVKKFFKVNRILFFYASILICIFMAKAGNDPFGFLTRCIILNMPFSRVFAGSYEVFQFPIILSYSILFGYSISTILEIIKSKIRKELFKFLITMFIVISLFVNSFPYFTGSIIVDPIRWGNANVSSFAEIPEYYFRLRDYISSKSEDFKLASLPIVPWNMPTFRWKYGYLGVDFQGNFFKRSVFSQMGSAASWDKGIVILNGALREGGGNLQVILGILNVRYVILHKDIDILHGNYLGMRLMSIDEIEKVILNANLTYIQSFGLLDVYEVNDEYFRPHIYPANIVILVNDLNNISSFRCSYIKIKKTIIISKADRERWGFLKSYNNTILCCDNSVKPEIFNLPVPEIIFKKINPTKYIVEVKNATYPFFLVFSETYDPRWKVYVEDKMLTFDRISSVHPDINVMEAFHEWDAFTIWDDIFYLFKKPSIDETYHFVANGYANAWYIDPDKIDKDHDHNFLITIYFLDQSLFYLGIVVSFLTLVICAGYLLYKVVAH
jgi:hypothetical protein